MSRKWDGVTLGLGLVVIVLNFHEAYSYILLHHYLTLGACVQAQSVCVSGA